MSQLWQHFIEQLVRRNGQYILLDNGIFQITEKTNCLQSSYLLQTEDERLGTLNLINLPSLTHGLLDNVTIIIVILGRKENPVKDEEWAVWSLLKQLSTTENFAVFSLFKMLN